MKTVRQQAKVMGHSVAGALRRGKDDVFFENDVEIRNRTYIDDEGTEYGVNCRGQLVYIAGEDWVI